MQLELPHLESAHVDFSVRESQRARNVTLKVSRRSGLEVVVPEGFDYHLLPEILSSRQSWIDGQLARFESLPGRFEQDWPPQQLQLEAAGVTFDIDYHEGTGDRIRLQQEGTELQITLPADAEDVRGQKTRWGSFSSRGTLSLNYKLLFLPEPLLRHVILHELSHSVHMNHSDEFWNLLHSLDPDTATHDKQLSEAWKYLPAWLE